MPVGKPSAFPVGTVFGRLTVIGAPISGGAGVGRVYPLRCACGASKEVTAALLRAGIVQSCGCLRRDSTRLRAQGAKTPEQKRKLAIAAKARAERERRLREANGDDDSGEPASGYVNRPTRVLKVKEDAVRQLAAAFGLCVMP